MSKAGGKVPAVTFTFWIIKILATTLGETGGDAVSMTWLGETTPAGASSGVNGYLVGTAIFGVVLIALIWLQVSARRFNPWLYWATIIASTTAGTTLADFSTRSIGPGLPGRLAPVGQFGPPVAVLLASHVRGRGYQPYRNQGRRDILLDHDHLFTNSGHGAG